MGRNEGGEGVRVSVAEMEGITHPHTPTGVNLFSLVLVRGR